MSSKKNVLKQQFLQFAKSFAFTDRINEDVVLDLKDVVWLLQSLGFNITSLESNCSGNITPKRDGFKGLRLISSCSHSQQTCTLEYPTEENYCNCIKPNEKTSESTFWEVVATTPSKTGAASTCVETGSDQIPSIPKEKKQIIKSVVNFLIEMLRDSKNISKCSGSLSERYGSGNTNELIPKSLPSIPAAQEASKTPEVKLESPYRHRSLDAIGRNIEDNKPIQGDLEKTVINHINDQMLKSLPNIPSSGEPSKKPDSELKLQIVEYKSLDNDEEEQIAKPKENKITEGDKPKAKVFGKDGKARSFTSIPTDNSRPVKPVVLIKAAQKMLKEAIDLIDSTIAAQAKARERRLSRPRRAAERKSLGCLKSPLLQERKPLSLTPASTSKTTSKRTEPQSSKPDFNYTQHKKSNKYANVKSTIPKAESTKK